jgi:dipeptidyl aminopeptidase/acylaminoacyl peptidase
MDWSPDGSTLAVSLRHPALDPTYDGIWLVDVATGETGHLVTVSGAESALQVIFPEGSILVAAPVLWSPDGTRLLFWAGDPMSYVGGLWCFWIDLDTREITAVPLPSHPDDQENQRMIWPYQAVWSPDGGTLLVAARQLMLPPDEARVPLYRNIEAGEQMALYVIDPAIGESTLLGHLPFEPAPLFRAAWGPDGDAIIAGYHLRLVQD